MTAAPPAAGAALELILRATLLIGAAWATASLLRKANASAAARHLAWRAGIFALLALPLVWWLAPPLRLPVLPVEATVAVTATALPLGPAPAVPEPEADPVWALMLLAYLFGVAALLLRFALSRFLVARLWRQAESALEADWQALLAGLSAELGLTRPVRLRIARGPVMPMTWGTLAPRILLPAEALSWPADQRRLVLLHELAHVARRDSFGRSAASLACALYWFHPGAWFAARQLRLEQEHSADDRVLTAGARPKHYARNLLDLAFGAGETRWSDHAAAMAGMCQLERRVMSITGDERRDAPGAAFHGASAAITALTVLAVAAALPVRSLPEAPGITTAPPSFPAAAAPAGIVPEDERPALDRPATSAQTYAPAQDSAPGRTALPTPSPAMPADAAARDVQPAAPAPETMAQAAPAAPPRLGPIGPQLPRPVEEQDSDPRIPAAFRNRNATRSVDQRAGPGPPRNYEEELLRTVPTALLQARGILPSR